MRMESKVAVIGALSIDVIEFADGRIIRDAFGGSAGYASLGASIFTDVLLVSNIGHDYPMEFLDTLKGRGVDTSGVRSLMDKKSTRFSITYDEELKEAENPVIELNAMNEEIRLPPEIDDYRYVYLAVNDPAIQLDILEKLGPGHIIAADTHKHWIEKDPELVKKVLERTQVLFIDDNEICALTGKKQLKNAGAELLDHGISQVIVKKGEHGAILFEKDRLYPLLAYDRIEMEYDDPTGCGGVHAGAFLGFLAKNETMEEPVGDSNFKALAFGLVVRSFKIEDVGCNRLLDLDRESVWRRYDQFRDMLSV